MWRSVLQRYPDHADRISVVSKVKAHRSQSAIAGEAIGSAAFPDFWGNHHADDLAKRGAKLHYPHINDIKNYKETKRQFEDLALHMIDVLTDLRLSRLNGAKAIYVANAMTGPAIKHHAEHDFKWMRRMWVCTSCMLRTFSPLSVSKSRKVCHGKSSLTELFQVDNGHKLWVSPISGGGTIVYCSKCLNYASAYPRNLPLPCSKPTKLVGAKCVLANRRHPVSRARILRPSRVHVA